MQYRWKAGDDETTRIVSYRAKNIRSRPRKQHVRASSLSMKNIFHDPIKYKISARSFRKEGQVRYFRKNITRRRKSGVQSSCLGETRLNKRGKSKSACVG